MKTLQSLLAISIAFVSLIGFSAEEGIYIPRIDGEPTLADFEGMEPLSELARSMSKVEGFIQRAVSYTHLTLPTNREV